MPIMAYSPHQENIASNKQNPAAKIKTAFHVVVTAIKNKVTPKANLNNLSPEPIFIVKRLTFPFANFFIVKLNKNPKTKDKTRRITA